MIKLLDLEDPGYVAAVVYKRISDHVKLYYEMRYAWIDKEGVPWVWLCTREIWRETPFVSRAAIEKAIQTLEEDGQILVIDDPEAEEDGHQYRGREYYSLPNRGWEEFARQ